MTWMLKRSRSVLIAGLCAVAAIVCVFMTGVLDTQKVWTDVQLGFRDGKTAFSREAGDDYGVVGSGLYYDLPAGRYRIKWQLDGDGENVFHLRCGNGAEISPSQIRTTAGVWEDEAWFEIKDDAHNVAIDVEFAQGSWMEVYNIRLYSPQYTDHAWSFAFAVLAAWLLFAAWEKGYLTARRCRTLTLLSLAVFVVSLPSLRQDAVMSIDSQFHMARIMNLADGLASGQFPVRTGGFSYNGYGAVTSVFYPDLFLYLPAVMILGGASMAYAVNVYCIMCHILAAVLMYIAARRIFKDGQAACCASILYVCALYRLLDVYRRFMAGEMVAMSLMPLFLLGLWEVFFGDRNRYWILVLSATLILRSHVLSTVICAAASVFMGVVFLRRLIVQQRLVSVFKAIGWALLLNVNVLVPMADMYVGGVNTAPMPLQIKNSVFEIWQVVMANGWQSIAAWIGAAAVFCCDAQKDDGRLRLARMLAVAGIAISLMTTELFPWSHTALLTGGLVDILQFTSRLLIVAAPLLALAGGYGLSQVLGSRGAAAGLLTLVIAVFPIMPYIEQVIGQDTIEFGRGANPYIHYVEYQIEGTDTEATRSKDVLIAGDAQLTQYEKNGTRITAQLEAVDDAIVSFPLFGFDGYAVAFDGERINWTRGENNRLTVSLPAGAKGELHIWFEGKALWRVTDVISLASVLGLIACVRRKRRYL